LRGADTEKKKKNGAAAHTPLESLRGDRIVKKTLENVREGNRLDGMCKKTGGRLYKVGSYNAPEKVNMQKITRRAKKENANKRSGIE